jgi:DNA-binding NarL/FixJ family response regulator
LCRPGIKVIARAVSEAEGEVIAVAEAGAAGYVAREGSIDDLVAVVESVARGEVLVTPAELSAEWRTWPAPPSSNRSTSS